MNKFFNYMYWNANGIMNMNRIDMLHLFLSDMSAVVPDILCISECKLAGNDEIDLSQLKYSTRLFAFSSSSSGLLFVYKSALHVFFRDDLDIPTIDQNHLSTPSMIKWLQIQYEKSQILLGAIYRHPAANIDDMNILLNNIKSVYLLNTPFVLLGDWNARHTSWESGCVNSSAGISLFNFVNVNNLLLLNSLFCMDFHTHCFGNCKSVIDLGVASECPHIVGFVVNYKCPLISDHIPISVYLSPVNVFQNSVVYWDVKNADWKSYKSYLDQVLSSINIFSIKERCGENYQLFVDELCEAVTSAILEASKVYIGKKKVNVSANGWYSDASVKLSFHYLRRCHAYFQRHYHNIFAKKLYVEAYQIYKIVVQHAKSKYLQFKLNKLGDSKKNVVWRNWKLLSYKNKPSSMPILNNYSNVKDGLNKLAQHFADISSHPAIDASTLSSSQSLDYVILSSKVDTFINSTLFHYSNVEMKECPFSREDVKQVCSHCNSPGIGLDGIKFEMISFGSDLLFDFIFDLFSYIYKFSVYPSRWKIAKVNPRYKSGKKSDIDNYRPISVTPVLSRILENLLLSILNKPASSIISPYQAGFRHDYSTLDNIFILHESILNAFRSNNYLSVLFVDIAKAFDTVWIHGLLYKLYENKVDLSLIKLLYSFLSNRYVYVSFNDVRSDLFSICYGVPHGCVLSPSLFLYYINSVVDKMSKDVMLLLFADDICLISKKLGYVGLSIRY
jgi:hypothetical protein